MSFYISISKVKLTQKIKKRSQISTEHGTVRYIQPNKKEFLALERLQSLDEDVIPSNPEWLQSGTLVHPSMNNMQCESRRILNI